MKILAVCSSLDLRFPYSSTPAWWQLFKGLYEMGVEVIVIPYQGASIESLWWKAYPNPCQREGALFVTGREAVRKLYSFAKKENPHKGEIKDSFADKTVRTLAKTFIRPRWKRYLDNIIRKENDIDAVIVFTVPLNHFQSLPTHIKKKYQIPVFYYDGDVPESLPQFRGFRSGFRIYQGADLTEYDGFISNSRGGVPELEKMGAKNVKVLYYGVDPLVFAPLKVKQDIDIFFYGHGYEYRKEWIDKMIRIPSKELNCYRFAVRATEFDIDLGNTERLPYASLSRLRAYSCKSKINLNITRKAHASVYASSSSRPFELASMGCCVVSNPYLGLEEWFEPKKEILVIEDSQEAIEIYKWLLSNDRERKKIGQKARERVLKEHTYQHRSKELIRIIKAMR